MIRIDKNAFAKNIYEKRCDLENLIYTAFYVFTTPKALFMDLGYFAVLVVKEEQETLWKFLVN